MDRNLNKVYLFIQDQNLRYQSAVQDATGAWRMQPSTANPRLSQPLRNNPANISDSYLEFSTNNNYFSLARSINYPLEFIKDGAFILNSLFTQGGVNQKAYLTIIEWDGEKYILSYRGRFDFFKKNWNPALGKFTCPCIDDSAWGVLSNNDDVVYRVPCNASNPKAIRVLVDGITLVDTYTFQTVAVETLVSAIGVYQSAPFVLVNQDGDSSGIIAKTQTNFAYATVDEVVTNLVAAFNTSRAIQNIVVNGSLAFQAFDDRPQNSTGGIRIYFRTSTGQQFDIFNFQVSGSIVKATTYTANFNFTLNLAPNERLTLVYQLAGNIENNLKIVPLVTNISITAKTKSEPIIVYALRPLDLLQDLVNQATFGRYTIKSQLFVEENKDVLTCGQALRGLQNAAIYSSYRDFFQSFNPIKYLAVRNILGELWMERATEVYKNTGTIIDLGEAIDCTFDVAEDMYASEIEIGSPIVDLRHPSGRLEFNSTNIFSIPILDTKNKISLVTKYRFGCYDAQFMILDYQNGSTQDNNGDNEVYGLAITDEIGNGTEEVETFIEINVDNATLNPIIKAPLNNDVIAYNKPVIRGIAKPGDNINIYVDDALDGNTVADGNGNWSYEIANALTPYNPPFTTGIHIIKASFTTVLAPTYSISITIDTSVVTPTQIIYPSGGDNLYNNKPLIKGVAQKGVNVNISIDGVFEATVVADSSCKWEYKVPLLVNGNRTISANAETVIINVNSNTIFPLITYCGSELDGFPLVNNLPLIRGVGIPGQHVSLYLNYISYTVLGTTFIDVNGNWEYQVIPITYFDPVTGLPVILAPIRNGVSIVSTGLINNVVPIGISGFKLDRPNFSAISGVPDNSVFNTKYSPKEMLKAHYPMLASMGVGLIFQKPDKNGNLSRTLNGVTTTESANVSRAEMGEPQFLLEYANVVTNVLSSFNKLLYNFNNGGLITFDFRGKEIFCFPIGSMKIANIEDKIQQWKLLLCTLTTSNTLLNLYKDGTFITLNRGQMFHSDYNSLHVVEYGFVPDPKYNNLTIYQEWFIGRIKPWISKPKYIQKFQRAETDIRDQIITNGVTAASMRIYDCAQATKDKLNVGVVATLLYEPVNPVPTPGPAIVSEISIDMSTLDNRKQYFGVIFFEDIPVGITERWEVRNKWDNTFLIEAFSSQNQTGFFYSTGIKTILRIEGLIQKDQPAITSIVSKDDIGNTRSLYNLMAKKAAIRFGTAFGLPDFIYLKAASAIILDNFAADGVFYTLPEDEKIEPAEQTPGQPLYFYNINVDHKTNERGKTFTNVPGEGGDSVFLAIDSEAMGLPPGEIISLELSNE